MALVDPRSLVVHSFGQALEAFSKLQQDEKSSRHIRDAVVNAYLGVEALAKFIAVNGAEQPALILEDKITIKDYSQLLTSSDRDEFYVGIGDERTASVEVVIKRLRRIRHMHPLIRYRAVKWGGHDYDAPNPIAEMPDGEFDEFLAQLDELRRTRNRLVHLGGEVEFLKVARAMSRLLPDLLEWAVKFPQLSRIREELAKEYPAAPATLSQLSMVYRSGASEAREQLASKKFPAIKYDLQIDGHGGVWKPRVTATGGLKFKLDDHDASGIDDLEQFRGELRLHGLRTLESLNSGYKRFEVQLLFRVSGTCGRTEEHLSLDGVSDALRQFRPLGVAIEARMRIESVGYLEPPHFSVREIKKLDGDLLTEVTIGKLVPSDPFMPNSVGPIIGRMRTVLTAENMRGRINAFLNPDQSFVEGTESIHLSLNIEGDLQFD